MTQEQRRPPRRAPGLAHVDTGRSMGRRVAGGAAWSSVGRLGSQALQFAASLVLARLLAPSEFGLLASVTVFTGFSQIFFDLGMGAGLVQSRDLRDEDLCTVFWLNALGGVVFAGLMTALAPLIAGFYDEPLLIGLTPLVALAFTANLGVCHIALLQRALRFKSIAVAELSAAAVGFATSIVLAALGWGVAALALGTVVQNIVISAILWRMADWRPRHFIARSSLPRIWRFSGGLLGFNVVNYWSRSADNLLVGRFAGAAALGYYNRAFNLMTLQVQGLAQVVGRVMFPTLSAMQHDNARAASAYRKVVRTVNAASLPALVGVAVAAPALVPVLWGEHWTPMVPLLAILCIAGIPQTLGTSVGWIYQAKGRTTTMFVVGLVTSALAVAGMIVGVRWGATGVAVVVLLRAWLFSIPTLFIAYRLIDLPVVRVLRDNAASFAVALVMGAAMWFAPVAFGLGRADGVTLLLQTVVGVVVAAVGTVLLQRDLLTQLRRLLAKSSAVDA